MIRVQYTFLQRTQSRYEKLLIPFPQTKRFSNHVLLLFGPRTICVLSTFAFIPNWGVKQLLFCRYLGFNCSYVQLIRIPGKTVSNQNMQLKESVIKWVNNSYFKEFKIVRRKIKDPGTIVWWKAETHYEINIKSKLEVSFSIQNAHKNHGRVGTQDSVVLGMEACVGYTPDYECIHFRSLSKQCSLRNCIVSLRGW